MRFYASFNYPLKCNHQRFYIHFGTGSDNDELLQVPIAAPGELDKRPLIRITLGTNPPAGDNDPVIGIMDGTNHNLFQLVEHGTSISNNKNPCRAANGQHNGRSGPLGDPVAGMYTLLFDPSRRFGSCATNNQGVR